MFSLLLILGIVVVFGSVASHDFLNYDDNIYVTANINVCRGLTWENMQWAFTAMEAGFWHPLTWLSLMSDYELYRLSAGGYHWTNVLFHIASSVLLFFTLYRMSGALWRSGFVAALFALHPLNVEPVAWVATRKDVLCTFFWMLTLWVYLKYTEKGGVLHYLLVAFVFAMGLMSKPMASTLPFVMLLLDYWPLGRFRKISFLRLLVEKAPLIILAFIVMAITFIAEQKMGAVIPMEAFPLDARVFNAAVSYVTYIAKMFWPVNMAVFYPHPGYWPPWQVIFSSSLLGIIFFIVLKLARRFPYLPVGWFWYVGTLIPVIGLIQIGSHAMADRYAYIPLIGLFIMISWGVADVVERWVALARLLSVVAIMIIIILASTAAIQVRHWENSIALFKHAVAVAVENHVTYYNLGIAYRERGNLTAAIKNFKRASQLRPDLANIQNNLGVALFEQGDLEEAMAAFGKAIQLQPDHAGAHNNIAMVLYRQNKFETAKDHFLTAIKLHPDYANAHYHLALIFGQDGLKEEALNHYRKAIQINPAYGIAQYQAVLLGILKD